eukprot:GFUD01026583.1.p1 GENE.GFUD01026583.1~~GFUD01026583.1.p1  ORF type:complete len:305 (+),score=90.50 GFUD01026583.1:85-999(+)
MAAPAPMKMETDSESVESQIIELVTSFPQGVADKVLIANMPYVDPKARAQAINKLLVEEKIDLFKSSEGLLYRLKSPSKAATISGDQEEKIVFRIVESSGNLGSWIRDIRAKSNLGQTQLNKVLKSLEGKRLIKAVKSVNATKKKVYMLYNLEPDHSVTGGAWYSDQDFESEFVEILNQQCYRFLYHKLETSRDGSAGPIAAKNSSMVSTKDVAKFITDLGISKVALKEKDIEAILNTIVYDGKAEKCEGGESGSLYRAVEPLLPSAGLARCPCGVCPVIRRCGDKGNIKPDTCNYFRDWLEEF